MKKLLLKIVKRTLFTLLVLVVLLTLTVFLYMRLNKFGKSPEGSRQERISQSPNFKDGSFQNLSFTPQLTEGYTIPGIIYTRLFKKHEKLVPVDTIPSVKTDLLNLPAEKDILVWF